MYGLRCHSIPPTGLVGDGSVAWRLAPISNPQLQPLVQGSSTHTAHPQMGCGTATFPSYCVTLEWVVTYNYTSIMYTSDRQLYGDKC